jgi:hypothetical protein
LLTLKKEIYMQANDNLKSHKLTRRQMLKLGIGLGAGMVLSRYLPPEVFAQEAMEEATPIVGDVINFVLDPEGRWEAPVGSVTLKMHPALFEGQSAWFIRTDASDEAFAQQNGLVYVPLLHNALRAEGSFANIYLFNEGVEEQRAVISTVPGQTNFTSAFRIHNVSFSGDATLLDSEEAVRAAEQSGAVVVEQTDIIVNYPLVLWPDGGLPVDGEMTEPLGNGPLIAEADTANGTVTFKLHQCYPGSRYIATDTSAAPMAPMMGVAASEPTQKLLEVGATAPIYVFGNGLRGTGAMGFQPAVFNAKAGEPNWSPFWEHFTVVWKDESQAEVLTSEAEIRARADAGEVDIFNGTPDSHPNSFVVNCPAPVLAPNTYDPEQFSQG